MNKSDKVSVSFRLPIWQLVLLHTITFCLYDFYWLYRNWKQLSSYNNMQIKPLLRTLGSMVPFLGPFLVWDQFIDIKKFALKENVPSFNYPGWLTIAFVILMGVINCIPDSLLLYMFLGFPLLALPLVVVQKTLNRYWEKVQPEALTKSSFSWQTMIVYCLGIPFYLLAVAGALTVQLGYLPN